MIYNYKTLEEFENRRPPHPSPKDIVLLDDRSVYHYVDGEWQKFKSEKGENVKISLFDINCQIFSQLPDYNSEQLDAAKKLIKDFTATEREYYYIMMSYGALDFHYVTLFHNCGIGNESIGDLVIECLENIGSIKDISQENNSCIEIWIKDLNGAVRCLKFFAYDAGVIEY